ncbi:hypothetical protein AAFF_G00174890 [Aldrovandia affinis]|uniref:3CxxC-type domain-containing protein n=1 Tax=Aldrovandia affinis TaxID=143900 RepID=A0AAD7W7J6_9TELE|nr:hypothetical protein AAFF_G00174890 [Aldrovandia affinis]
MHTTSTVSNRSMWRMTFNKILEEELEYSDIWTFRFNNSLSEERRRGFKIFCTNAKGHFKCGTCSKSWSSAQVTILFHYRLQTKAARGTVAMRPFGQACRRCNGGFKWAGFSPETVETVLLRLISKIKKNCYGEAEEDAGYCGDEKAGGKPHESSLCEACSQRQSAPRQNKA